MKAHDVSFNHLYQDNFYKIYKLVKNNKGQKADAEDLFQDAMLVLVEKLRTDDFYLTASINTYLYAICKNLWFKRLRGHNYELTIYHLKNYEFQESINISIENELTYLDKLKYYLTKITDHCNRLINDLFFAKKEIEQIQIEYNYSSKHNAQNQKHKCIKQIKAVKTLEEQSSSIMV